MTAWLQSAVAYLANWLEFQRRYHDQPGCAVAVAHESKIVLSEAFGFADLETKAPLTPAHRLRLASHSKSFTAAGIMLLRERGKLRLDDTVGRYVTGVHDIVAQATIQQLLSHSAGLPRDGRDAGQFRDRRSFLSVEEVLADLRDPPPFEPGERFKYSNHGYALLGLTIEAVTGESYVEWIRREVVRAAGLTSTEPDASIQGAGPVARGHSPKLPLGRRVIIPGDNPTNAIMPAGGFTGTASDVARFFAQLSPSAPSSILSPASRREMVRRHWRDEDFSIERHYGLGTIMGPPGEWSWFGHSGSFQGFLSRTAVLPRKSLSISILTNANDGPAHMWVEGAFHIFRVFAERGAPDEALQDWRARWWSIGGAIDHVPVGNRILSATPALFLPFTDASETEVTSRDAGRIVKAGGFYSPGEPVRRVRDADGRVEQLWAGPFQLCTEEAICREMVERYEKPINEA